MPQEAKTPPEILAKLRQNLTDHFNDEELRTLCFDMGINYEDLPGSSRKLKIMEFVAYLERYGRIAEFVSKYPNYAPDVSLWQVAPETIGGSTSDIPIILPPGSRIQIEEVRTPELFFRKVDIIVASIGAGRQCIADQRMSNGTDRALLT